MGLMQRPRWPRTSRCWRQCWPTWLACGGFVDTAAKTLFCHPNTVRYRLNRVAEHTGRSLTDPRAVTELILALQADYLGRAA